MLRKAGAQFTLLALFWLFWSSAAPAAPDEAKARAAELFEQGVRQFSHAQYHAAAKAFLAADELAPNTRALINGITAARRAGLHLLVADAAERALARADMDSNGAALAREALAEAARNLTHVEVTCAPPPCTVTLDGERIMPGARYVLPGTHDLIGSAPNGANATEHLSTAAGASYRVALVLRTPEPPPKKAVDVPRAPTETKSKPLSPAVFYVGTAATAALVGLTIWSGVDTLGEKSNATEASWVHVQHLALRTDLFLAGALVLGGATAAAGFGLVDWRSDSYATATVLPGGGAALVAKGRF
jgi:hypothetical protein